MGLLLEQGYPPSDGDLILRYAEIEERAIKKITKSEVTGNSLLIDRKLETRYSISAQGHIRNSPAGVFLADAIAKLQDGEPNLVCQTPEFLHFTLAETIYNQEGRKAAGIKAQDAQKYHHALREYLPDHDPIQLSLYRLLPTLDPPLNGLQTASIVASFLSGGDTTIFQIRHELGDAVERGGLPFSARLGLIRILFVTLGRFAKEPTRVGETNPILEMLDEINSRINDEAAIVDSIQLISTAASYLHSGYHVFLSPAIPLRLNRRINEPVRFLRPWQMGYQG